VPSADRWRTVHTQESSSCKVRECICVMFSMCVALAAVVVQLAATSIACGPGCTLLPSTPCKALSPDCNTASREQWCLKRSYTANEHQQQARFLHCSRDCSPKLLAWHKTSSSQTGSAEDPAVDRFPGEIEVQDRPEEGKVSLNSNYQLGQPEGKGYLAKWRKVRSSTELLVK
jgi:hypothetical protein